MAVIRIAHNASMEAAQAAAEGMQAADLKRERVRMVAEIDRLQARLAVAENTIRRQNYQIAMRHGGEANRRRAEYEYRKTLFFTGLAIGILAGTAVLTAVAMWRGV